MYYNNNRLYNRSKHLTVDVSPFLSVGKTVRACAVVSPVLLFFVFFATRPSNNISTYSSPISHSHTSHVQKSNNMHTRVSIAPNPALFDDAVKEQLAQGRPLLVYVIGARDEHGQSWCPDCVKGV